jgi:hypothetical protein
MIGNKKQGQRRTTGGKTTLEPAVTAQVPIEP